MSEENYVIFIEVDQDEGIITLTKGDFSQYIYQIEELEGKGVIDNARKGGASGTVYSQGEVFTLEEYQALFGNEGI